MASAAIRANEHNRIKKPRYKPKKVVGFLSRNLCQKLAQKVPLKTKNCCPVTTPKHAKTNLKANAKTVPILLIILIKPRVP